MPNGVLLLSLRRRDALPLELGPTGGAPYLIKCSSGHAPHRYTCHLLLRGAVASATCDYEGLAEAIGGPWVRLAVELSTVMLLLGTNMGGIIQIGQSAATAVEVRGTRRAAALKAFVPVVTPLLAHPPTHPACHTLQSQWPGQATWWTDHSGFWPMVSSGAGATALRASSNAAPPAPPSPRQLGLHPPAAGDLYAGVHLPDEHASQHAPGEWHSREHPSLSVRLCPAEPSSPVPLATACCAAGGGWRCGWNDGVGAGE